MAGKRLSWLDVVNCYFTLESADKKASHVALALLGKLHPLGAAWGRRQGRRQTLARTVLEEPQQCYRTVAQSHQSQPGRSILCG